jgi:spermidine synthase
MRLDDPYALIAAYTRQMMSFLLFEPDPEQVLLIGLGGGSLAKFCYRNLPHARITVVEIDARVIALREAFSIPPDDHRFRIVHDDGARYLSTLEQPVNAILIDAFDPAGVSPSLATPEFFYNASRLLAPTGALIMNLHGDAERFAEHLQQARKVFGSRALLAQVTANDNVLLYAFAADAASPAAKQLFLRARHLQSKMPLNFRHYLQRVREGWAL